MCPEALTSGTGGCIMNDNRKTAYRVLLEMEKENSYSNIVLNRILVFDNPESPAFVREMVYAVTENRIFIDYAIDRLVTKGIKSVKPQPLCLLRLGICQIEFMNSVPDYAAVSETVKLARRIIPGRDGFINGVLRNYLKMRENFPYPDKEKDAAGYLSVRYSYARWIVEMWLDQYGLDKTEHLLKEGNETPPLFIRTNTLKTTTEKLTEDLKNAGFPVWPGENSARGVSLKVKGSGLLDSKLFSEGHFSVQDEASLMAAELLNPKPGETVVDVCAAPGGKSFAMAEMMKNTGIIYALDIHHHKIDLIDKGAQRLGIDIIRSSVFDSERIREDLRGKGDCVLADVPCTGLGVVRRKPEIKLRDVADRGKSLAQKQLRILKSASAYVKTGGKLLYSTCTLNRLENADVVGEFLRKSREFELVDTKQLLPEKDGPDGFFMALMRKRI